MEFSFPLDFNRKCDLRCDRDNHKSVLEFPGNVDTNKVEELDFGALLGHPIPTTHCSPFMTHAKPNSDWRQVIIDLSWPLRVFVNAGITLSLMQIQMIMICWGWSGRTTMSTCASHSGRFTGVKFFNA